MVNKEQVISEINEYCKKYRNPDLEDFDFSELYDLFPKNQDSVFDAKYKWPQAWPISNTHSNAGVYFVFNSLLELIYIGKASMNSGICARLNAHFKQVDEECQLIGNWSNPKYFFCVFMPHDSIFEAPALEEYLISKLKPCDNASGK